MRYQVTICRDYLKVMVTPTGSSGDPKELLYAVSEAVFEHGRKPILICGPGCGPLSLPDIYILARHVIDTPLRHGKIAFVYQTDSAFKSSRFVDELGAGRGLHLNVFPTEDDATDWLVEDGKDGN